jgi:hypothetical protein
MLRIKSGKFRCVEKMSEEGIFGRTATVEIFLYRRLPRLPIFCAISSNDNSFTCAIHFVEGDESALSEIHQGKVRQLKGLSRTFLERISSEIILAMN